VTATITATGVIVVTVIQQDELTDCLVYLCFSRGTANVVLVMMIMVTGDNDADNDEYYYCYGLVVASINTKKTYFAVLFKLFI